MAVGVGCAFGEPGHGAALTLVYVVAWELGLMLAFVHASATAVRSPTGIALLAWNGSS